MFMKLFQKKDKKEKEGSKPGTPQAAAVVEEKVT
eukprot:CAMPEP_0176449230 /NCGR_PEP_ID=MMETSP0127-20121128/26320_1 /TAXON_ID=938130 /ORGANISM="Platyophrya macrostoma, Strain WH" /LENGTH=33 /DNA_ID= /DNA_START= /DNA_END= /DNA_ORIENTATION=